MTCEWCSYASKLRAELAEAQTELEGCITLGKDLYYAYATIDKLQVENARLRAEGEEMDARWHAEVANLTAERDHWKQAREAAMAAGEVLKAENARLHSWVGRLRQELSRFKGDALVDVALEDTSTDQPKEKL